MTDHLTKKKRSWNMSRIRAKNTKPEIIVRSFLHRNGFRFRLHRKDLPGKPDIVLKKYNTVIFVHGCFWHQHEGCKRASIPDTNKEYWVPKLEKNKKRFEEVKKNLDELGWNVAVIWECETKNKNKLREIVKKKIIDDF